MIVQADSRCIPLADESVQCCVTSPPYWGLRDYGTGKWIGGDPSCAHKPLAKPRATRPSGGLEGGKATVDAATVHRDCHCGARRVDRQIGLEPTPDEYVQVMVAVFREVWRVLRRDGVCWVNLGDSYATGAGTVQPHRDSSGGIGKKGTRGQQSYASAGGGFIRPCAALPGLKPKDLVGIPWRVAFALQADGWWLRQDCIWHKPNPMPESVTDRCTKAHEYVFLLTKAARYRWNGDAVREVAIHAGKVVTNNDGKNGQMGQYGQTRGGFLRPEGVTVSDGRNPRSVWTIPTQAYPEAHFATFPEALAERCILAGSFEGDTVFDPFGGSGTVGAVAERLGRRWVVTELNAEYIELIKRRTAQRCLL